MLKTRCKPMFGVFAFIAIILLLSSCFLYIQLYSKPFIYNNINNIPHKYTGIVLGAKVGNNGTPSNFLADRLDKAVELYKKHKISRFLLTGDHGQVSYDEVNNMKSYLLKHGIPEKDIFLDHAGFDTYDSMVRAINVFEVKEAIIVTQEFHLKRSVYIARKKGMDAYGIIADNQNYGSLTYLKFRESFACIKAFLNVVFNSNPKFLGPKIPITGESKLSYD